MANTAIANEERLRPETWHPTIKGLYDYWISIHPPVGLPGRQHVDPCAIPHLLPRVFMVDVSRHPLRFKYRLVGTEYVQLMGKDLTGQFLDEVHPGFYGTILRHYTETAEFGQPAYRKGPVMYTKPDRNYLGMERVIVPLARDGRAADMILGAIVFSQLS
jgi:hypothetical protein